MAPIRTPEDALRLVRSLAEYDQRRLHRLQGVGSDRARVASLYDQVRCKICRDACSDIARRINRGIEQGKHPELKRPKKPKRRDR
jgi:hypothetical protein